MLAWGLLSCIVGYLGCALLAARAAYGVQRTRIIERDARLYAHEYRADPVTRFENNDQSSAATGAFLFGLAWPLTVPGYCLYRCATFVITANPPPTGPELERRAEEQARRIEALEEALRSPIGETELDRVARVARVAHEHELNGHPALEKAVTHRNRRES